MYGKQRLEYKKLQRKRPVAVIAFATQVSMPVSPLQKYLS